MSHTFTSWDNPDKLTPPEFDEEAWDEKEQAEDDHADFLLCQKREREFNESKT